MLIFNTNLCYLCSQLLVSHRSISFFLFPITYIYVQLAGLFQPYPPTSFPEVFMCKGGEQSYATFDSFRRTWTFDITYDRSNLSFSQLYFNLFVNLAGQKREDRVRLRIDKESYFEIYKEKEEM